MYDLVSIKEKLSSNFTIIGGSASTDLAKKIAKNLRGKYVKPILKTFPDGEKKITIDESLKGRIVVVQSTYLPVDSNLMEALFLISYARKYSTQVYAVIPYLGYARQDKEFLPGEVVSMSVVAKMIKAVGTTKIFVVDIHSKMALNHFKIPAQNISAIAELVKHFKRLHLKDPLVVCPDIAGVFRAKNFSKLFGTDFIGLRKHRDRYTGSIEIRSADQKHVKGRNIVLVDDMISTGGSMVEAAKFLKKQGCGDIYAACTHALLLQNAEINLQKAGILKIVSTNTIPRKTSLVDVSKIIAKEIA